MYEELFIYTETWLTRTTPIAEVYIMYTRKYGIAVYKKLMARSAPTG